MSLTKIRLGNNEDGTPHYHFMSDDPQNEHVVFTGPHVSGILTAADDTPYDVTEPWISVKSIRHAVDICNAIGRKMELEGHPHHLADPEAPPFQMVKMDYPGKAKAALLGTAGANAGLNGLDGTGATNVIGFTCLHVSSPGTTGANENANAGSYARQSTTYAAAASSAKANSNGLTFTTLGTIAVSHFSGQSSGTYGGGSYGIGGAFGASVTAASISVGIGALSIGAS